MVRITDYDLRLSKDGKPFNVLILQGEPEVVQSKESGNSYMTTKKAVYAVICACLVLAACEQVVRDPVKLADQGNLVDRHDQLVWPPPPAEPER